MALRVVTVHAYVAILLSNSIFLACSAVVLFHFYFMQNPSWMVWCCLYPPAYLVQDSLHQEWGWKVCDYYQQVRASSQACSTLPLPDIMMLLLIVCCAHSIYVDLPHVSSHAYITYTTPHKQPT